MDNVWVFHGDGGHFASGVFTSLEMAEEWIIKYTLNGLLTNYPLNAGAYDWAILNGFFEIKKEHHTTPEFIQRFANANNEHYHYENGKRQ